MRFETPAPPLFLKDFQPERPTSTSPKAEPPFDPTVKFRVLSLRSRKPNPSRPNSQNLRPTPIKSQSELPAAPSENFNVSSFEITRNNIYVSHA